MSVTKLWWLPLVLALALTVGFAMGCGDDDDDDDDDDDATADDDDDTGDDDAGDDDAVDELLGQAYDACVSFWSGCDMEDIDGFCTDWVESYRPAIEEYADVMDTDCMMQVMGDFFTCVGEDCDPTGAWATCNEAVQEQMLACFE